MDDAEISREKNTRKIVQKLLSSVYAEDIMRPRSQVTMINAQSSLSEILQLVIRDGHSRFPVFLEKIDNIIGVLYVKDLLRIYQDLYTENYHNLLPHKLDSPQTNKMNFLIHHTKIFYQDETLRDKSSDFLRKPLFVSENKKASELLIEFKTSHIHMAIVVDEYGTMLGIITLEDILEEIVGEINDEFDKEEDLTYTTENQNYIVYPRMNIEEFNKLFKTRIKSEDFETIGGFILDQFGYVPKESEFLEYGNYRLKIRKVEGSKIREILVEKK